MDLLGDVRQKGRDKEYPHREGALKIKKWDAPALLLGRLPASLKLQKLKISARRASFRSESGAVTFLIPDL